EIVPLVVIGPPISPAPVATLVTVPALVMSSRKASVFGVVFPTCNLRRLPVNHRSPAILLLGSKLNVAMFRLALVASDANVCLLPATKVLGSPICANALGAFPLNRAASPAVAAEPAVVAFPLRFPIIGELKVIAFEKVLAPPIS